MGKAENIAKLVAVKLALAKKYENLVNISGGQEKKLTFTRRAKRYRNQAAKLQQVQK